MKCVRKCPLSYGLFFFFYVVSNDVLLYFVVQGDGIEALAPVVARMAGR